MVRSGLLAVMVLVVATVSGCGAGAGSSAPAASPTPSPAVNATRTNTPTPTPIPGPISGPISGPLSFRSPSGNITCVLTRRSAACAVASRHWVLTAAEKRSCGPSALQGAELDEARPAHVLCGTGVLVPHADRTLEYGATAVAGRFLCRSEATGVTCRGPHHAFMVSRTELRLS